MDPLPPPKRGRNFGFTWKCEGSPEPKDVLPIDSKYVYQKESGSKTGYVHWQGYVMFPNPVSLSFLKEISPVACWYNRKGTHAQMYAYCTKSDSRLDEPVNVGIEPVLSSGSRTDLAAARALLEECKTYGEVIDNPELDKVRADYPGWIKEILSRKIERNENFEPRPWQEDVIKMVSSPCDNDRVINWYYDENGNAGKTVLAKFLTTNHGALFLSNQKSADVACIYDGHPIVCFNFSRTTCDRINYEIMENLKDGILMSGKYQPVQKVFKSPHVLVFANFKPKEEAMSSDRWNVVDLSTRKRPRLTITPNERFINCAPNFNVTVNTP